MPPFILSIFVLGGDIKLRRRFLDIYDDLLQLNSKEMG